MSDDIRFPDLSPCALCVYYATGEEIIEPGRVLAPGIGKVCHDCHWLVITGRDFLNATPGFEPHMIPDGDRNSQPRNTKL